MRSAKPANHLKRLEEKVRAQEVSSANGSTCNLNVEAEKSLEFLGNEYDDLHNSDVETKTELARTGSELIKLANKLEEVDKAGEEFQENSHAFNVKIIGVQELGPTESAEDTRNLCLKIFDTLGAHVTLSDIDIVYRVALRDSSRPGPKPIVSKFTRRLARNRVMAVRKQDCKISTEIIGLSEDDKSNIGVFNHLTPRKQKFTLTPELFSSDTEINFAGPIILDKNVKKNVRCMSNFRILPSKARFTQDTSPLCRCCS